MSRGRVAQKIERKAHFCFEAWRNFAPAQADTLKTGRKGTTRSSNTHDAKQKDHSCGIPLLRGGIVFGCGAW